MMSKLQDICFYVTEKMSVTELTDKNTYISTENMLPDKGGITIPATIPADGKITAYKRNDVLVSNIRPYFKKIWFALSDGGCSNDVLVFRVKEGISPDYLHYILADNAFFDYAMKTSKGTKMPRGDKKAIMEYEVAIMDFEDQQKTSSILRLIDQKIAINNTINENLEQQAQALFKAHFENNNLQTVRFGDIATFKYGKMPKKDKITVEGYPLFSGYQIVGYYPEKMFDEPQIIVVARGVGGCGDIKYTPSNCYLTNLAIAITPNDLSYEDYLFRLLKNTDMKILNTGSAQPQITVDSLQKFEIPVPSREEAELYSNMITPIKERYRLNIAENLRLASLRDTLLPKLMNGEIDVSAARI